MLIWILQSVRYNLVLIFEIVYMSIEYHAESKYEYVRSQKAASETRGHSDRIRI